MPFNSLFMGHINALRNIFFLLYWLNMILGSFQEGTGIGKYSIESNTTTAIIHIMEDVSYDDNSFYQLYYKPSIGTPPSGTKILAKSIGSSITISKLNPGTTYDFKIFYTNNTNHSKWQLVFNAITHTEPEAPLSLSVSKINETSANIEFSPPKNSGWIQIKLQVEHLDENNATENIYTKNNGSIILKNLISGGSYHIKLYTVYNNRESSQFKEIKFTTLPKPPMKFIVWDRNETSLKILPSPPRVPTIYSGFKLTIEPNDTQQNIIFVKKEQQRTAAFTDLIPGKLYNVSVQTVSNKILSKKISQIYKTLPLPPSRLRVIRSSITNTSFSVTWDPPEEQTEFDKYQISIDLHGSKPVSPVIRNKTESRVVKFSEGLRPGHTYKVNASTVSGQVSSLPASINATLRPNGIKHLAIYLDKDGHVQMSWKPNNASYQDSYEISYSEVQNGSFNGDSSSVHTNKTHFILESLLPGRNYSISVKAVSKNITSWPIDQYLATKPSSPNIEELKLLEYGFNISWKSEVDSRQDNYEILYFKTDFDSDKMIRYTMDTHYLIDKLYPGALYHVEIVAISHGLRSHPHTFIQAVYPKPPVNIVKRNISSNSLTLIWEAPTKSLFSNFSVRYKAEQNPKWTNESVNVTRYELRDLIPGEHYIIQVNTVSHDVESRSPLIVNHLLPPSPVTGVTSHVDTTNITFEFPRPEGRIELYNISWFLISSKRWVEVNELDNGGKSVKITVTKLKPGVMYHFRIKTKSHNLQSEPVFLTAQTIPLILSQLSIETSQIKRNIMIVTYSPTFLRDSQFDRYHFDVSPTAFQEKNINDTDRRVTFTNLTPGMLYTIKAFTQSGNASSEPICKKARLYPDPVTSINATNITENQVILAWKKPLHEVNSYEVKIFNRDAIVVQNITTVENFTVTNLKPYTNYTATVISRAGSELSNLTKSLPCNTSFQTNESLPGMVQAFEPIGLIPREIIFDWQFPYTQMNGNIIKFTITCTHQGSSDVRTMDVTPFERRKEIKDLLPGEVYKFSIKAATKVGYGPEATYIQRMPILAPPKPSSEAVPKVISHTATTIHIQYDKQYFSNENGQIKFFTIIVTEDDKKNSSALEMLSWNDVQSYRIWPPYQVMEPYYPFNYSHIEDYIIGEDNGCQNQTSHYCNGPLKEGSTYRIKIRAFTTEKFFTDTDYSEPIQTDQRWGALAFVFSLPVIFVLLFGANLIMKGIKKKFQKRTSNDQNIYELSEEITSKPVKTNRFAHYYDKMAENLNLKFSEEFEKLQHVGQEQPCIYGRLFCNTSKNRYTNILPYDHSRFKLQPIPEVQGSDYINANYIHGYNSLKEYIVTQGPLLSTIDDFWRMCWESNTRAIVMLTQCVEEGGQKCERYWPDDDETICYGNIYIKRISQQCQPDWTISQLNVRKGVVERTIWHFHFTSWLTSGVPNPPTLLVRFAVSFRHVMQNEHRPLIVHCNAGVGRSGTFIAIDQIIQSLNDGSDVVDVYGIVYRMRKERPLMVQTEQQYITIHKCALYLIENSEDLFPEEEQIYQNLAYDGYES